jgi:hypothetical protein
LNELKISSSSSTISLPQQSQTRTTRRTNSNSNHPLLVETIYIYSNNDDDDEDTVSPPPPHPSLSPEIDHYGNIEYKLKLCPSSTTPITTSLSSRRLDKLTTQLKWRLVQGGGFAIYELGVLDQGELIGLNKQEMESSLKILGEMLRNLLPLPLPSTGSTGGGLVRVNRCIKLCNYGEGGDVQEEEEEECPFQVVMNIDHHQETEEKVDPPPTNLVMMNTTTIVEDKVELTSRNTIKGPTPFPSFRTSCQQSELKRSKRDASRRNNHQQQSIIPQTCLPLPSPRPRVSKPPRSSNKRKQHEKAEEEEEEQNDGKTTMIPISRGRRKGGGQGQSHGQGQGQGGSKPCLKLKPGEIRWVVEAIVEKRPTSSRSTTEEGEGGEANPNFHNTMSEEDQLSSPSSSPTSVSSRRSLEDDDDDVGGEGVEEEEGWNFLSFDLKDLTRSVKEKAAALSPQ